MKYEPDERVKDALIVGLGLTVAMFLLPPAIFGGRTDSWGKFIFDYQTLLAGLAAVAAARFTVRQMRLDSFAQERRHREAMDVEQRHDRLALERLASVIAPLRHQKASIEKAMEALNEHSPGAKEYSAIRWGVLAASVVHDVAKSVQGEEWKLVRSIDTDRAARACVHLASVVSRVSGSQAPEDIIVASEEDVQRWKSNDILLRFENLNVNLAALMETVKITSGRQ